MDTSKLVPQNQHAAFQTSQTGIKRSRGYLTEEDEHLLKELKVYNLKKNLSFAAPTSTENLRIVVMGKTGVGKSATANTILGKSMFKEDVTTASVTTECSLATIKLDNDREICVIDTPGLQDTNRPPEEILVEVAKVVKLFREGIHAFVYVLNLASPRFTKEDENSLAAVEMMFGSDMKKYRLLVYTHADNTLNTDMSLDDFCSKQQNSGNVAATFLKEMDDRVVAVNNKTKHLVEKRRNQNVVLEMIDKMVYENNHIVYRSDVFIKASQLIDDLTERMSKIELNLVLSDAIEKVTAAKPELSSNITLLKSNVKERLQEEIDDFRTHCIQLSMDDLNDEVKEVSMKGNKRKRASEGEIAKDEIAKRIHLLESKDIDKDIGTLEEQQKGILETILRFLKENWNKLVPDNFQLPQL